VDKIGTPEIRYFVVVLASAHIGRWTLGALSSWRELEKALHSQQRFDPVSHAVAVATYKGRTKLAFRVPLRSEFACS
jgi:hypothetical protein